MTVPTMTLAHINKTIRQIIFQFRNCLLFFFHHSNHKNVNDVFHSICQRQACALEAGSGSPWAEAWTHIQTVALTQTLLVPTFCQPIISIVPGILGLPSLESGVGPVQTWWLKSWSHIEIPFLDSHESQDLTMRHLPNLWQKTTNIEGKCGQHAKPSCPT